MINNVFCNIDVSHMHTRDLQQTLVFAEESLRQIVIKELSGRGVVVNEKDIYEKIRNDSQIG